MQDALRSDGVLFTLRDLCPIIPACWRSAGGYDPTTCAAVPVEPRAVG